jgi:AcrR family transcriptional regulator
VPRISPDREAAVRDRIIRAALEVFAEKGYRGATIADVVRRSGLSVGAIYTHFSGKEALFLQSCDHVSGRGLEELATRLAPATSAAERLRLAIELYIESIDQFEDEAGQVALLAAWAEAEAEPGVREMLVRRRERLVGAAHMLIQDGVSQGELPAWLDVDGIARAFLAMLDGLLLQRVEAGAAYRPADTLRRATAMLDVLLAAARADDPGSAGARPAAAVAGVAGVPADGDPVPAPSA